MQHPYVYGVLVFEAMATFIGQVSVLSLIALFGAATTAMVCNPIKIVLKIDKTSLINGLLQRQVTTARKAVTLLLSYMIFTKPLTEQHGSGLLLITMGIVLKMLPENKPPSKRGANPKAKVEMESQHGGEEDGSSSRVQIGIEEDEEKRPLV